MGATTCRQGLTRAVVGAREPLFRNRLLESSIDIAPSAAADGDPGWQCETDLSGCRVAGVDVTLSRPWEAVPETPRIAVTELSYRCDRISG